MAKFRHKFWKKCVSLADAIDNDIQKYLFQRKTISGPVQQGGGWLKTCLNIVAAKEILVFTLARGWGLGLGPSVKDDFQTK